MYVYGVCLFLVNLALSEDIHEQLTRGLCLCIEDDDVFARADPGEENPIVGVIKKNNCFVSSGGLLHRKGITWYEAHTVAGKNMWINGYHLRAENMTVCTNPTTTPASITSPSNVHSTTTEFDPFAGGLDFCVTSDGQMIDPGKTHVQNGVLCTCTGGTLHCPTTTG